MQLPKHTSRCCSRKVLKLCAVPTCNKEFLGRMMQKYCFFHMEAKNRIRARRDVVVTGFNVVIKHSYTEVTPILRPCSTCHHDYTVMLYPRVEVYPDHCEKHRTEFQRAEYARTHRESKSGVFA